MTRPSILFIISDEHSPLTMGCYGARWARTPNLDRLAAQGTTFENAYCPYALCVPARSALMSGLDCHRIKAYDNGAPLPSDLPTWAHMLTRAGYRTELNGKMHFLGPDQLHGFQAHVNERAAQIGGFRWGTENPSGLAYKAFSTLHVVDRPEEHDFWRRELAIRDRALAFLQSTDRETPFCLTVGFSYPHYPMVCDRRVFEACADLAIPDPVPAEALHPRNHHFGNRVWGHDKFTPAETRASRQAYVAMVCMLDAWVGEILDCLEAQGLAGNTVVIYSSDHGDMWGEHGMWGKNMFYEDSARVPLVVCAPFAGVQPGARIATPVSLLDLYPTFRDLGGIADWDVPLDGRSLWPAARGAETLADVPVFCSYYGSDTRGPERMVRFRTWKLNYYHHQGMELFDLACDPQERENRSDDPACAAVKEELLGLLMAGWDPDTIEADIRVEQNRRTYVGESLRVTAGKEYHTAL